MAGEFIVLTLFTPTTIPLQGPNVRDRHLSQAGRGHGAGGRGRGRHREGRAVIVCAGAVTDDVHGVLVHSAGVQITVPLEVGVRLVNEPAGNNIS